jgi:hypothetical protein
MKDGYLLNLLGSVYNRQQYHRFSNNTHKKLIEHHDNYNVYRLGNMILGLNDNRGKLSCYVNFKKSYNQIIGHHIKRVIIWSLGDSLYELDFDKHILFDYLLPTYGSILMDNNPHFDMNIYWKHRFYNAMNMSDVFVYYIVNNQLKNYSQFNDDTNFEKMILSNKRLPELKPKQQRVK